MKEEYKDFVGIYDESVPIELCNEFAKSYEKAKKNRTFIDLSKENETGVVETPSPPRVKRDEVAFIAPTYSTIYPQPPVQAYFQFLRKCFECYIERYGIQFRGIFYNDVFEKTL